MNNVDLEKLKKHYGEDFAKLCRQLFPSILEEEGRLFEIISKYFAPSRSLFEDITASASIDDYKNFVFSQYTSKKEEQKIVSTKSPFDLMKKAGYTLHKCNTNEDVLSFKKYWKQGEELCTFRDPNRINSHIIYFAVKNDVDKIKREDFKNPLRQDKYGTSVISIQFSKGAVNTISIKNRYNHFVTNPDATFSNDLENICAGLTESFVKECNLNLVADGAGFKIPRYVNDNQGRHYKYNLGTGNVYYCGHNVVIGQDRIAHQYDKSRYELIDHFLLDKLDKKIVNLTGEEDYFTTLIQNIQKIEVNKLGENIQIVITTTDGQQKILVNKNNALIGYENTYATTIGDNFLKHNTTLKEINLPNVTTIGDDFLSSNRELTEINLPNVTTIGNDFLSSNRELTEINLPNVTTIGDDFLSSNRELTEINLPNVTTIGDKFLYSNRETKIIMPNVTTIGDKFLCWNNGLTEINLPNVTTIGKSFLFWNEALKEINLPNVTTIGDEFLYWNDGLTELNLPNVTTIGDNFLLSNTGLKEINLPNVTRIGNDFLYWNNGFTEINLPKVIFIGVDFLSRNTGLKGINLPKETRLDPFFWVSHKQCQKVNGEDLSGPVPK